MFHKSEIDFFGIDLDSDGFAALSDDVVNDVIQDRLSQQLKQKSINRRMMLAALKRGSVLAGDEEFGFTSFLDWRGRFYTWAVGMSYQGKDSGKASVMAATPKALGDRGLYWLGAHVATCHGETGKEGFAVRAQWTADRYADGSLAEWVAGAMGGETYEHLLFDEPVQFVVAAADYIRAMESGDPETYESGILCTFDATCSGLQVLGTMLRDEDTAGHVNVLPRADGSRADIYMAGGEALMKAVRDRASKVDREAALAVIANADKVKVAGNDESWAIYWADRGVTRAIMKRPVMVFCYGGKARSMAGYIKAEAGCPWAAATWLATVLYKEVLPVLLPRAYRFMEQLQELARVLAKAGKPVRYTLPDGFVFHQEVQEVESEQVDFTISSGRIRLSLERNIPGTINAGKQATGIAPNVVHSFDALFLRNVILAAHGVGVDCLSLVHDCFGYRAGDAETMFQVLRETWVKTFEGDVVGDLWRSIAAEAGATIAGDSVGWDKHVKAVKAATAKAKRDAKKAESAGKSAGESKGQPLEKAPAGVVDILLPPIPTMGGLDINVCMDSEFLFS